MPERENVLTIIGAGSHALPFYCLLLLSVAFRSARAQVMSSPDGKELTKATFASAGGAGFADVPGNLGMAYALSQPMGSARWDVGSFSVVGGFHTGLGTSGIATAAAVGLGGACPPPGSILMNNTLIGLSLAQAACVGFNKPILPSTLAGGVTLALVRDSSGNSLNAPVAAQVVYDVSSNRIVISNAGAWNSNSLYRVTVGTRVVDQDGLPLPSATIFQFLTLLDPGMANTLVDPNDPGTRLNLAPNALTQSGQIVFNPPPLLASAQSDRASARASAASPSAVSDANAKFLRDHGGSSSVLTTKEIDFYDAQNRPGALSFAPGAATLSISYQDAGGGIIAGTQPPARVKSTALYVLDDAFSLWEKLPGSAAGGGAISAPIPHLSVFAALSASDVSVSDAYAFPVPFRPHGPAAGTGPGSTGTESGGITFVNLPSCADVGVYDVRGERAWASGDVMGAGKLTWNTQTSSGRPAASGVYLYVVKSCGGSDAKVGKLIIIR